MANSLNFEFLIIFFLSCFNLFTQAYPITLNFPEFPPHGAKYLWDGLSFKILSFYKFDRKIVYGSV